MGKDVEGSSRNPSSYSVSEFAWTGERKCQYLVSEPRLKPWLKCQKVDRGARLCHSCFLFWRYGLSRCDFPKSLLANTSRWYPGRTRNPCCVSVFPIYRIPFVPVVPVAFFAFRCFPLVTFLSSVCFPTLSLTFRCFRLVIFRSSLCFRSLSLRSDVSGWSYSVRPCCFLQFP